MPQLKLLPVPHLVFKVDSLKGNSIGAANAFIIRIEKNHDRESVYRHEVEHVKQWWFLFIAVFLTSQPLAEILGMETALAIGLGLGIAAHPLLYKFVRKYRMAAEVMAFKKSIAYGRGLDSAASALSKYYNLGITHDQAERLLRD